jgi:type II secretory pathway pseudopilin PulG
MNFFRKAALRLQQRDNSGMAMIIVTMVGMILMSVIAVSTSNSLNDLNNAARQSRRSSAFQAAEAGLDDYISKLTEDHSYYLHYVHPAESTRVSGATTVAGGSAWSGLATWTYPTHNQTWRSLSNGFLYNLEITPPTIGSPNITIVVTGKAPNTNERRRLEAIVRTGSIADFQMVANRDIGFGSTATTTGKIYAGIDEFGVAHNVDHLGNAWASVFAEGDVTSLSGTRLHSPAKMYDKNTSPTIRSAVQSPIIFNTFTESMVDVKTAAGVSGLLLDDSTVHGWRLQFTAAGTIVVNKCTRVGTYNLAQSAPTCVAFSTVPVPANGAIYVGQTAIVEGVVDGQVTVVSNADIVIGNNTSYELAGNDVLGLIAKNNVYVAQWSPNTLSINAALIAQTGEWRSWTFSNVKTGTFTHLGAAATNLGGGMSMFTTRVYTYDNNLLFLQPPFFPILEESYTLLDFRELNPT